MSWRDDELTSVHLTFDTSVVLRLLTGVPAEQALAAQSELDSAPGPVAIDDVVVAEAYHALCHHYKVPPAEAVRALHSFVGSTDVIATGQALHVLGRALTRTSPGLVDQLIHATNTARGGTLLTFDRALSRLSDVRLLK